MSPNQQVSKELARKARQAFRRVVSSANRVPGENLPDGDVEFLTNFLKAAENQLPTRATINRDLRRKRWMDKLNKHGRDHLSET